MIFILNYSYFLTSLQNRQRTLPSLNQLDIELGHFILKSMRPKKTVQKNSKWRKNTLFSPKCDKRMDNEWFKV